MQKHKLHIPNKLRVLLLTIPVTLTIVGWTLLPQTAHASGDAYFVLSPSSGSYTVGNTFTLNVYETSQASDNVEGVQANLSYNSSYLQCNSVSVSGTSFTYLGQDTCGGGSVKIGEASGSTVSGQQFIGAISFKVLAAGGTNVSITTGSDIQNSSTQSVWNGVDTNASYTLSNPPTSSGGGSTGGSSGNGSTGGASSISSGGSGSVIAAKPSTTTSPSTTTQPKAPSSANATKPTVTNVTPKYVMFTVTVTDSAGKPIRNAKVVIDNKDIAYTNTQGTVLFSNLTSGKHNIVVTAPGWEKSTSTVELFGGQSKSESFKLASSSSSLESVLYIVAGLFVLGGAAAYWFIRIRPGGGFSLPWGHNATSSGTNTNLPLDAQSQSANAQPQSISPSAPRTVDVNSTPPTSPQQRISS